MRVFGVLHRDNWHVVEERTVRRSSEAHHLSDPTCTVFTVLAESAAADQITIPSFLERLSPYTWLIGVDCG